MAKAKTTLKPVKKTQKKTPKKRQTKASVEPVFVDSAAAKLKTEDALIGCFATVVKGEYSGKYGVLDSVVSYSKSDGYPDKVIFITRDENSERLVVNYSDLQQAVAGKR